jgi:N utilization substance protein A
MPKHIKFDEKTLNLIRLFTATTDITVKDCIADDEAGKIVYVVAKEDVGKAIGKNALNVKYLREKTGKEIDIIGFSEDPAEFLKNVFLPAHVNGIDLQEREGRKVAVIRAATNQKGIIIGRNGRNINKAKVLARRHFDLDDVVIFSTNV